MPNFWLRPLLTLGSFLLLCLFFWALAGAAVALGLWIVLLLAYLFYLLRYLDALGEWLAKPVAGTVPHGYGIWGDVFAALYQMVRRQSRSKIQLSAALERFQRAGEAIPDGVIMLDDNDLIEWINPVAEQQFSLSGVRDQGRPIHYLLRQPQFTEYLAAQNYSEPLIMKSTRTHDITLSVQLVPFGYKQKLLISRDITQLENVEVMRRDFIANVSHELRTPLTVVGGFLETMLDQEMLASADGQRYFHLMLDQTQRMQHLVEDLLTLSRLESTSTPLQEERVDIPGLLQTLYREAESLSGAQHRIRVEIESPAWLQGNGNELRSAFGNLISNAVRYTPPAGEITLRWENSNGQGRFSVSDTGPGIEPHHLPRLTERFYRVDRSRSRETGGTGLGLSIVKHVLSRHQAHLEIVSEIGKGSTFSAIFPSACLLPPAQIS